MSLTCTLSAVYSVNFFMSTFIFFLKKNKKFPMEKHHFINNNGFGTFVKGIIGEFWTSGTRMLDGKTWVWMSTAKPVEYQNWAPGQPNNKNDQCILTMKTYKDFGWNDRNCNCRFFFICEKTLGETVPYDSKKKEPEIRKFYRSYFD